MVHVTLYFCPEVLNYAFICLLCMNFLHTDSSAFLYICLLLSLYPVSYWCLCYFAVSGCSRFPDPGGPWSRSPGSLSYPGALLCSVIQESKYSETCLIRHLCNPFHCVIRHPVYSDKISPPSSACWITAAFTVKRNLFNPTFQQKLFNPTSDKQQKGCARFDFIKISLSERKI